ncbi:kinase-like domain-containing protein [Paraphysoderma sedebokerense]|nr:kinase-like domain-containing protein [Paraphysoderma sedebokerense]
MPRSSDPFPPGISNSQINSYQLIRTLGTGAFGRAILSFHPSTQKYYVLKKIDILKSKSNGTDVFLEARLLGRVNHRNVVALKEWFVEGKWLYLVTEFAESGDLYELIQSRKGKLFSESTIMTWFVQLCWGLGAVHDSQLLHRDIKTKNIFLSNSNRRIILGDFGIAKLLQHPQEFARTVIGTPYYLSPEICKNIPYNSKSDVWALGCVLYEICTLQHPFNGKSMDELVGNIICRRQHDIPSRYSPELINLVNQMLDKDPRLRPSVSDILRKPFMQLWVQKVECILRETPKVIILLPSFTNDSENFY